MVYICYELELSSCLEESQSTGKEEEKKGKITTKQPFDKDALKWMKWINEIIQTAMQDALWCFPPGFLLGGFTVSR